MAMGRRPLLVMVVGWVAVVAAVGAITFVVVSDAGRGVGQASAAERVVVVTPTASGSSSAPFTRTPTPSLTPTPSATPQPTPTPPSTEPDATAEPRPTSRAPRPAPPAVDRRTASFSTEGGIIVAYCRGRQIYLKSIRPRDGWRYKPESSPLVLEVSFKRGSEDDEKEIDIKLSCVDEIPTRAGAQTSRSKHTREEPHESE